DYVLDVFPALNPPSHRHEPFSVRRNNRGVIIASRNPDRLRSGFDLPYTAMIAAWRRKLIMTPIVFQRSGSGLRLSAKVKEAFANTRGGAPVPHCKYPRRGCERDGDAVVVSESTELRYDCRGARFHPGLRDMEDSTAPTKSKQATL